MQDMSLHKASKEIKASESLNRLKGYSTQAKALFLLYCMFNKFFYLKLYSKLIDTCGRT